MISDLRANATRIRDRVTEAAERADRDPASVTIVAVSKTFPREDVNAAYDAGFRVFGENRVQEIREKYALPFPADLHIHMIGSLQTNKIGQLLPFIDVVETVDRLSLVEALQHQLERHHQQLEVMLEVNVSGEAQKAGVPSEDAGDLLRAVIDAPNLVPVGFMTMAPLGADEAVLRSVFGGLRRLRDQLQHDFGVAVPALSMGMSNDFEIAIEEGATHVRIGRALFGERL